MTRADLENYGPPIRIRELVAYDAVPPALASALAAKNVVTWADAERVTDWELLSVNGVGRTQINWLRKETELRKRAVCDWAERMPAHVKGRLPRLPNQSGVYFIQCGSFVKIGLANNVRKRYAGLQQTIPFRLELLGVAERGADRTTLRTAEKAFHIRFKSARQVGEWFRREGDLDVFCLSLATGEACV